MVALSALVLCLANLEGGSFRVQSAADLVVPGTASQVVATSRHVFALVDDAVIVVDAEGRIVRRMPLPAQQPQQPASDSRIAKEAANRALFDEYGFPEHLRTSPEAERWLEDTKSLKDRTRQAAVPAFVPPTQAPQWLLEANADAVFLATALGVWTIDDAQPTLALRRVAPLAQKPSGLAVSLHGMVSVRMAGEDLVVNTGAAEPQSDVCVGIAPDIDQSVVLDSGGNGGQENMCMKVTRVARSGPAVWVAGGSGAANRLPLTAASLTSCGAYALVNAAEGLFAVAPRGGLTRVGPPAPYAHVRCLPAFPDAVVSFDSAGSGVKVSADGGARWTEVIGAHAQPSNSLVFTENAVWMATSIGLLRLSKELAGPAAVGRRQVIDATVQRPPWVALLPTVHVTGMWSDGAGTAKQQSAFTMVSAEFPLQTPTPPRTAEPNARYTLARGSADDQVALLHEKPPACLASLRAAAARVALAEPERMRAMIDRTRTAAWLPELRVRAEKRWGRNQSVDLDNETTLAPLGLDTVNDLRLEVRASWDLARLVYSPDELAATVAGVRVADSRQEVGALVNRLFFARREKMAALALQTRLQGPVNATAPSPTSNANETDLGEGKTASDVSLRERIAQITADLDALTAGATGECW